MTHLEKSEWLVKFYQANRRATKLSHIPTKDNLLF